MNKLSELLSELDNQIGYAEQVRLDPSKRTGAINQALRIVYGLLTGTNLIKASANLTATASLVTDYDSVATPPSDFNEGRILYIGDDATYEDSCEVFEVDEQKFGRWDDEDWDCLVQRFDSSTGELKFYLKGLGAGSYYFEYERGAPTLVNDSDYDWLPKSTRYATAKLAAGILTDNLLADSTKLQIHLYGPTGNPSRATPDSCYGMLQQAIRGRRIGPQSGRTSMATILED